MEESQITSAYPNLVIVENTIHNGIVTAIFEMFRNFPFPLMVEAELKNIFKGNLIDEGLVFARDRHWIVFKNASGTPLAVIDYHPLTVEYPPHYQ